MKTPKSAAMFARVDEWERSGQSMREFASSIGLSKSTLTYWVRRKRKSSGKTPSFVELSSVVRPKVSIEANANQPVADAQAQLVFTFPDGMCIKIYR